MKYVEEYLNIDLCREIIKKKNNKQRGSLWCFFWTGMEEDDGTASDSAKKCKHLEKNLVRLAEKIIKANDEFEKKGKPIIKELLKHTYKC